MNPPAIDPVRRPNLIYVIMAALFLWGGYLAIGAIRAPGNHATWRGLIVFGCMLAFLGMWAVALAARRSRSEQSGA